MTIDPSYEGYLVFGLYNVSGTPFQLKPGIKLVGANFCELMEEEILKTSQSKPKSILNFPERLQELIGKYKPVNPQNISDELKKLQIAFDDSQSKLDENIRTLKSDINCMRSELMTEISKREQESIRIENQLSGLERKMENINDSNIRHEQSLLSVKENIKEAKDDLRGEIRELKTGIDKVNKTFNSIKTWATILAAILTVVGTVIVTLVSGVVGKVFGI